MPRRKQNEAGEALKPLISFDKVTYERESFKLNRTTLTRLKEYATYVKENAGIEPTLDEIVDKGMQRLFDADKGFRQWLQKRSGHLEGETNNHQAAQAENGEQRSSGFVSGAAN